MSLLSFAECEKDRRVEIAIVGAGIAGLYCAWRLARDERYADARITVVERLNRTGGRLDTDIVTIKPGEKVREEEGGMRFNYGMHELMNLIKAVGRCDQIVSFPMGSEGDSNRYFLRGRSFTLAEANAGDNMIWSELYDLDESEIGLSPTDLVTNAYRNILYANDLPYQGGQPPEFWTEFREKASWNGKTMNRWLIWGLLREMGYSEECVQMLTETIGFAGPFKGLANAGDAFQILADFPKDPTYYTFERGFSTLPDAIVKDLEDNHGDRVHICLSTNVDAIHEHEGGFRLAMTHAPDDGNSNPYIPGGEEKSLVADKLILAVATNGMERLFIKSPALNRHAEAENLWTGIHAALGMKLMKINLYFDKPWWENGQTSRPPIQFGPNFSDLPVNAVYPFYALPEGFSVLGAKPGDPPAIRDAAAALTIYCDFDNTNFWRGLQNVGPAFTSHLQEIQNQKRPQTMYAASQPVVAEARRQLADVFGVNWVPEPVLTSYRLWNGEDDFEYAYHQWRLNVVDSEVRRYLAQPFANVHLCNEAISDMQGWVNGSLRSANAVLEHFDLEPLASDPCPDPKKKGEKDDAAAPPRRVPGLWGG